MIACVSAAQDFPRYELSAGYSYGSPDDLSFTSVNRFSPQGWNGSFATNLKRWVALEVDAGGQYINKAVLIGGAPYSLNSGFYSFQAGPRFAYRGERVTPFFHTLFGVHRTLSYAQATFPNPGQVLVPYENAFGTAAGVGMDVALTRRLALRTQGDYFLTRLSTGSITAFNGYEDRFRIVGGIVFNFGATDRYRARRSRPPLPPPATPIPSAADAVLAPVQIAPVSPPPANPAYATITPAMPAVPSTIARPTPAPSIVKPAATAPAAARPAVPAQRPVATYVAPTVRPAQPAPPIQTTGRVVPAPAQNLNGQLSDRPKPAAQEESLGEIARRYRAQRKKQLEEQSH